MFRSHSIRRDKALLITMTVSLTSPLLLSLQSHAQGTDNPNLALHKTYDVSDPNTHHFGIGALTDGSWAVNGSGTFATGETPTFPKSATIDLGQATNIAAVVVGIPPVGSTKTVSVSVSADGTTFKDEGSFAYDQGKEERHIYTFPSTSARYVRLNYLDHYDTGITYSTTFAFTEEAEVYAKDPGAAYLVTLPVAANAPVAAPAVANGPVAPSAVATPSNPLDLAFGKSYVVSDPNVYNYGIGGLTDGSWSAGGGHTFATGDKDEFPKTATIDLGASKSISAVVLGVPAFGSTKTISVSISTDGAAFTSVGTHVFDQSKEARNTYTFPSAQARYIRLTYPDHYDASVQYPIQFAFTEECEVYANAADAPK